MNTEEIPDSVGVSIRIEDTGDVLNMIARRTAQADDGEHIAYGIKLTPASERLIAGKDLTITVGNGHTVLPPMGMLHLSSDVTPSSIAFEAHAKGDEVSKASRVSLVSIPQISTVVPPLSWLPKRVQARILARSVVESKGWHFAAGYACACILWILTSIASAVAQLVAK